MEESDLKNALIIAPTLIEEGLRYKGREIQLNGRRCDLLFEDKNGHDVYVEAKLRVKDNAAGQIMRYEYLVNDESARFMIVGFSFMDGLKEALEMKSCECKELLEEEITSVIERLKVMVDIESKKRQEELKSSGGDGGQEWERRLDKLEERMFFLFNEVMKEKGRMQGLRA